MTPDKKPEKLAPETTRAHCISFAQHRTHHHITDRITEFTMAEPPQQPPPQPQLERISLRAPPFWKPDPRLWFFQVEAQFSNAGITSDQTKFNHVVAAIDSDILAHITDFLLNPPVENKYEAFKNKLIGVFSDSQEKKLNKLLGEITLGDKKPSQLLSEMTMLGGTITSPDLLKTLWMQHLPPHMQSVLAASTDNLEQLAVMADKIAEIPQPRAYATAVPSEDTTSEVIRNLTNKIDSLQLQLDKVCRTRDRLSHGPRNRSRTPQPKVPRNSEDTKCWYHAIYQQKARKCIQPCNFSENSQDRQ